MITARRGAELALLTAEAALRARAADATRPPADLAEWLSWHAAVCPELAARLPQVGRLLRAWPAAYAQAPVARAAGPAAPSAWAYVMALTTREAAEQLGITASGSRWLCAHNRFPGARRDPVTGRWLIPAAAVAAYAAATGRGRDAEPHTGPGVRRRGRDPGGRDHGQRAAAELDPVA